MNLRETLEFGEDGVGGGGSAKGVGVVVEVGNVGIDAVATEFVMEALAPSTDAAPARSNRPVPLS